MKPWICVVSALFLVSTFAASPAPAATIHVPGDWPSIQVGISAATDGDIVLVAPGTYYGALTFRGKAITVMSEEGPGSTVIDGDGIGPVVAFAAGETETSVLEGFTITGGDSLSAGGGILCSYASPTIRNCAIVQNNAGAGGAIYCFYASPTITNCTMAHNACACGGGGGIRIDQSNPTITNCIFWDNETISWGEIFVESGSPVITYCTVQGGFAGEGNIDADPLFLGEDDYRLGEGSPGIDAGHPGVEFEDLCSPPSLGLARNDMGAFGGPGACGRLCWDDDEDGFDDAACGGADCDDTDPTVSPDGLEGLSAANCADGIDNDCDGLVDADPECAPPCSAVSSRTRPSALVTLLAAILAVAAVSRRVASVKD